MIRIAAAGFAVLLASACATTTPIATSSPPGSAGPSPSVSAAATTIPAASPTASPSATPTASLPTLSLAPIGTEAPTAGPDLGPIDLQTDLAAPGTLGVTRDEFVGLWNGAVGNESLQLRSEEWEDATAAEGVVIGHQYFHDSDDDVYNRFGVFGVLTVVNSDATLRSVAFIYFSSGTRSLDPAFEWLIARFGHSALIDAVIPDVPEESRFEILPRLDYPEPEEGFEGHYATTAKAGVRFRLSDEGEHGVLLLARQDNSAGR